jgi:hypothetical protein
MKGNNTPESRMGNHRHFPNLTLQGERGRTVVGLLRCGHVLDPSDVLT